ncbi:hypothetical protein HRTV-22_gp83 [Halorubrum virus HRTV-22]|nr:hypothetical protein HRTV-18_gp82 [Halorubrum virus HRTV-18]UBF19914.1 hypothetical protein HRTV-20_gp82 [Halorubrum virus HRTV-20]UBF20038.1 hypothetical protein HRTV-22_gp83 [Halorubrum virus HRTV-22]UBF20165.1 hypothetical protein HRTV-26_gp84 [Halorubrum virus HRTV-26]
MTAFTVTTSSIGRKTTENYLFYSESVLSFLSSTDRVILSHGKVVALSDVIKHKRYE